MVRSNREKLIMSAAFFRNAKKQCGPEMFRMQSIQNAQLYLRALLGSVNTSSFPPMCRGALSHPGTP